MDTIIVILIVGLAISYLYRHFAANFKKGATPCGCNGCAGCSVGCPKAGDHPKAAGIMADFNAPGSSVCADVNRFSKKNLPHSSKKIMDG